MPPFSIAGLRPARVSKTPALNPKPPNPWDVSGFCRVVDGFDKDFARGVVLRDSGSEEERVESSGAPPRP